MKKTKKRSGIIRRYSKKGGDLNSQTKLLPEDEQLARELRSLGFPDQIVDVVVREKDEPEGKVRLLWLRRLVKVYRFPASHINIEVPAGVGRNAGKHNVPVRADIVVYRDEYKTKPFSVVETKSKSEKVGVEQAESYARNLGAEYHLWSNGEYERVFKTSRYPNQSDSIARLPVWVMDKPIPQKIPKSETLRPFKDEEELRQVISFCHDLILEKLGHDPAKAFDEIAKLLFLKLYDEREVPKYYDFAVLANENPHDVAERIRKLFDEAIGSSKYQDVFWSQFNTVPIPVTLELDDFTILNIVQLLQGYSLVNTTENIQGADIKGTVYEQMVGNTFRGELAQFFTPRELVEFLVEIIRPERKNKILDPACGSGGFLIMVLRKLREWIKLENPNLSETDIKVDIKYFAEHKAFGIDISDRMVRVAKMNMIMHGDGHSGIFHILRGGGLLTDPNLPDKLKDELKEGTVDIIFSNPPFAGHEKDPKILEQFELGKNEKGKPISVSKEVLFIERIIKLLRYGGKAGLVLPAGVFNNPSMKRVRDYIKRHSKIIALVGLPHLSFQVTGANNEGHLLFIERVEKVPEDYPIFIDWANYVGIDVNGRKIERNDLHDIVKRFLSPQNENIIMFSQLKDRIDPWYYHPKYAKLKQILAKTGHPWVTIGEVFQQSKNIFDRNKVQDKSIKYIEKGDVDMEAGIIRSFTEHTLKSLPTWAHWILQEGDVLLPRAYDSMRGVAIVPKENEGFVCTGGLIVVKHNPQKIRLPYVRYHFTRPEILALIKQFETGEINPKYTWKGLSEVELPLPSLREQDYILKEIEKVEKEREAINKALEKLEEQIDAKVRKAVPKVIGNYEEIKIKRAEFIGEVEIRGK